MSALPQANEQLVFYDDLLAATNTASAPELAAWLDENQVPYFRGRGRSKRPFTTLAALNSALGVLQPQGSAAPGSDIQVM